MLRPPARVLLEQIVIDAAAPALSSCRGTDAKERVACPTAMREMEGFTTPATLRRCWTAGARAVAWRTSSGGWATVSGANDGFGSLYNRRPVEIVLRPKAGVGGGPDLYQDPRRWRPHDCLRLDARLEAGECELFLALPDLAESLRSRPEYAIRFANQGVWAAADGINRLAHVVKTRR